MDYKSDSESDISFSCESNDWLVMSQCSQTSMVGHLNAIDINSDESNTCESPDLINTLDDYSLLLILSKLSFVEKIIAQKVCKKWRQLVFQLIRCQSSLGVAISFAVCDDPKHQVSSAECIGDEFVSAVEDNTKWYFVTAKNLSTVLSKCPNLKSLMLQNCIFCREVLEVFTRDCSSYLEHLDLSYSSCNINEILQILSDKCCDTLKHVMLKDNEINENALKCLIKSCKELEVLVLDQNIEITGNCFNLFGDKISRLSIVDCISIDESGIKALVSGNGKHIKHLQIGDSMRAAMFQIICEQMISLTTLEFNGFKADSAINANSYNLIANLQSLQELVLTVTRIPFDTQFIIIIGGCRQLKKIKIDGPIITDTAIKQIPANCPNVEQISINPLDNFTNSFITDECRYELVSLRQLKSLSLCSSSITDIFVEEITRYSRLSFIELDSCNLITNKSLDLFIEMAISRPNDKIMVFVKNTNLTKPTLDLPSNLYVLNTTFI
ncbi:uncharacterized protein LOC128963645 [Oppia nitens]|uniref:uncharacterized protein LOC128963645 n=1 Tax=Oppia nitens TaxID=1686743 RepID=UPI0023DAEE16|nr:uncharacterized protein LOC128963645 [Oppia nitens]